MMKLIRKQKLIRKHMIMIIRLVNDNDHNNLYESNDNKK